MMQSQVTFDALILGLKNFLWAEEKYPYPLLLQQSCNALADMMPAYPKTLRGFLSLLEQPLENWWPFDMPEDFDADSGLTYEDDLSEEANHYYYEELIERDGKQKDLENRLFAKLLEQLRSANYGDQAQEDYVLLRSFLIENADTTRANIREVFADKKIGPRSVGDLYEDCGPRDVWTCDRCGPLREKRGRLRGLRPSACDDHSMEFSHVHRIAEADGRCRVRTGIHLRTTLPGIPEMSLFHAIEEMRQEYPQQIQAVYLWPGLDRYDLRLEFCDGTSWAVDVKDHRKPVKLAENLIPLYGEGDLYYDQAFYVFPLRRLQANPNYIDIVQENAPALPNSHSLIGETSFQERVAAQARRLQKQGKKEKQIR